MDEHHLGEFRDRLYATKDELMGRLERISLNVRRTLDTDSAERAKQVVDHEVVDALGNEARRELAAIDAALTRIRGGSYGICISCHEPIAHERLDARPYAAKCIDCATD